MFINPMRAILSFAENRGKDADILTNRLNQVFGPMAEQLIPASAPGGFSMGETVAPPQAPVPAPFSPAAGLAAATMPNAVDTSQMMVLGEVTRGGQQMLMLRAPDGTVTYQPKDVMPGAQVGQAVSAGGGLSGGLPDFADFTPPAFAGGSADIDSTYRNVADALNVRVSSSGAMAPTERRDVESVLGSILNEIYDPESTIEANKRQGVADLFTGLGIGFGQMSRGDRVDLSEVRTAAAQRQREQTALRMERAKRAAGASYAMELGDEGLARAIAGGAADVGTLLTKRQQDIVNTRADEAILRQSQRDNMLANVLAEDGSFSPEMVEAIRAGVDPSAIMKVADRRRAADLAVEAQERAESQIEALRAMQQRAAAASQDLAANMPPVDPIIDRALMLAEVDGYRKIYEGGTLYDYMSEARQQAGEMRQQTAETAESAKEAAIQRALELPQVNDRETAIKLVDGFLELDRDGVLRDLSAGGEPVTAPTAGLSPTEADAGPPRDTTGTSLFNRVGQATGLVSAGQGVLESTLGQVTGGAIFPERAETIQELNTLRGVLVDAFRNSGRLLSQELALLLDEVAPGSSVWQSPGQLEAKMASIDRELRQRLAEERARANDRGVPTTERTASANLARDIDRVLTRLHQPAAGAAAPSDDRATETIPEEVRRSPAYQQLREAAENSGVTPEEIWQFLPPAARERFMQGAE